MRPIFTILLTAGVLHLSSSTVHDGPLLYTKQGIVRGDYVRVRGKTTVIHAYLGLPFAKAPVGNLRLAPPQPSEGWEGVRDATQMPLMCVQDKQPSDILMSMAGMIIDLPGVSEDCLYLNVYTPAHPAQDVKLPVMVWIHGGGLIMGCAALIDGSVLAAYQNVVVVAIQYRVGMLGFFSTGDENAPGNFGFLDQVAALQWVQENIHSFGGDPSSVTILGESAGGISVSMLVLSPLTTGLFHRAIAESGTAMSVVSHDPKITSVALAHAINCPGIKPDQIVDCIMQMTAEDIVKFQQQHPEIPFTHVTDGHFLPKAPEELLESHAFNKVPLINGVTNHEYGWILPSFMFIPGWDEGMSKETSKAYITVFNRHHLENELSTALIMDEYVGNGEDPVKNRDGVMEYLGDCFFTTPSLLVSNAHRDSGAPVFAYEFQHPPSVIAVRRPSFVKADHSDELAFVFGGCFLNGHVMYNGTFTEEENQLCKTMMAYWGNFARTGSPNGPGLTHWPAYGTEEEYLAIGLKQKVGYRLKADRFIFLTETLPGKIRGMKEKQRPDL